MFSPFMMQGLANPQSNSMGTFAQQGLLTHQPFAGLQDLIAGAQADGKTVNVGYARPRMGRMAPATGQHKPVRDGLRRADFGRTFQS
jgi:hypothetical protein